MNRKPQNLTTIVGRPYTPILLDNNKKVSLSFVLETKKGPILCNYYSDYVAPHPIGPMTALVCYAHETSQEIEVEGGLVEKIIDNTGDPKKDKIECCINVYQITFPTFGTYIPVERHTLLPKEINSSQG